MTDDYFSKYKIVRLLYVSDMISPHEYLKSTIYHYLGQVFTDIDEDEVKVSCYDKNNNNQLYSKISKITVIIMFILFDCRLIYGKEN
jgi:hypothetical protein